MRSPSSRSKLARTTIATATAATAGVLLLAGTASAHIDPDPAAVEAGTAATVGFGVEHGCEGSPTVELQIQIPDSITDAQPVDKDGWTASVADGDNGTVVTFADGSLDAETPDVFSIDFTAPGEAGTINFPIVQTCEVGQLDWIEIAVDGQEEPEHPAPALLVTAGAPTDEEVAPEHEESEDGGAVDDTTQEEPGAMDTVPDTVAETAETVAETVPADTIVTTVTETVDSAGEALAAAGDDDDSNTGLIIGAIVVGVIVIIGAGYLVMRRGSSDDSGTEPPTAA